MILLKTFGILLLVYGVLVLMAAGCQWKMIYFPSHGSEKRLLEEAQAKGMEPWRNGNGDLIGWKSPLPQSKDDINSIVVFHGNAGYALHRDYFVEGFSAVKGSAPWIVYIFEYPGYGARPGRPSEKNFKAAAEEAVTDLFSDKDRLYLVGESIGTGVASHLAQRFPERIDGLLLITPFTSLADVGKKHYPILPIETLLRERYDNLTALKDYSGPVAVLIAGADEIIPVSLGRRLYDAYSGPKAIWIQEGRGHNSLNYDPEASWWKEVINFLQNPDKGE
ncbi:alpha/beta hydrolase [Desulfopila inferna]|uniref:alpha/beta hydrolase n=1 Tax=Desulfopila inferna TaxID=468528 RepID=UPI00196500BC|nr:alpha/beta hydrolase [Desulfopila inferna]MBM9604909.1 alpha/beta hydrolase [Desulfopila inferna]